MFQIKVADKMETHILCSIMSAPPPPPPKKKATYVMWKNDAEWGRPQCTVHAG